MVVTEGCFQSGFKGALVEEANKTGKDKSKKNRVLKKKLKYISKDGMFFDFIILILN